MLRNFDETIIQSYNPILAKGGSKAIRKRKRTMRNKKSITPELEEGIVKL